MFMYLQDAIDFMLVATIVYVGRVPRARKRKSGLGPSSDFMLVD